MSGIKSKEIEGCVGVVQSGMKELRRSSLSLGWEGEKDVAEKQSPSRLSERAALWCCALSTPGREAGRCVLSSLAHSRTGGKERQIRFASCKATAEVVAHALLGVPLLRRAAVVAR